MLIDTKQIVPKTNLRQKLNAFIKEVKKGKTFVISDRGEIVAVLSSPQGFEGKTFLKENLLEETVKLAMRIDRSKPRWESLPALKKLRQERIRQLKITS